jgi:hypothetical protein
VVPPGVDALAAGPGLMHPPWRKRGDEIALPPRPRTDDNAPGEAFDRPMRPSGPPVDPARFAHRGVGRGRG